MMGICYRYSSNSDDARALVNQGYLKVLDHIEKYDQSQVFEAWLRTVTVRVCIDDFRKQKNYKSMIELHEHEHLDQYQVDFDLNEAETKIDLTHLELAMKSLPEMSKKVFNLFAVDGFSHQEISDQLGMSVGTSKWHVNAARTKLKTMLSGFMKNEGQKKNLMSGAGVILLYIVFYYQFLN